MTDVLSDVLSHLDIATVRCTRLEATGSWALHFDLRSHFKFISVVKGDAWLIVDGHDPFRLERGDLFLLASSASYTVGSDPDLPALDGLAAFDWTQNLTANLGGDDTVMLGGALDVHGSAIDFLFEALPSVIHIPASLAAAEALRLSLALLEIEVTGSGTGHAVTTHKLAEVLFVQALRLYSADMGAQRAAWLTALADPRIGRILNLIHADPARRWTVDDMAELAGMSRSSFATAFAAKVGMPPLSYLQRWRMERARTELRKDRHSTAQIANAIGYSSEAAFGAAYKRQFGRSPGMDRNQQ